MVNLQKKKKGAKPAPKKAELVSPTVSAARGVARSKPITVHAQLYMPATSCRGRQSVWVYSGIVAREIDI